VRYQLLQATLPRDQSAYGYQPQQLIRYPITRARKIKICMSETTVLTHSHSSLHYLGVTRISFSTAIVITHANSVECGYRDRDRLRLYAQTFPRDKSITFEARLVVWMVGV